MLFLIIVVGLGLAFVFGGLGGGLEAYRAKRTEREPPRPTHATVRDDGASEAEPGSHLND
ncbi:hypothetical protein [Baekduia sp.]|uniref:hypothetical protein n=1 Tax=Baekduia sp. TaxID=2600305 RepID=UPI002DF887DC|nr:hypothetical protein [Baekduia sp.]